MRTFFCLEIPEKAQREMADLPAGVQQPADVKWVSRENLHITVKFLGDTDDSAIGKIRERARRAVNPLTSFSLEIDQLGCFPEISYPKVIWLGASSTPREIHTLHENLESQMEALGFPSEERDYVPHITLGRTKDNDNSKIKEFGDNLSSFSLENRWRVELDRLTLMKSELRSSGPVYSRLFQVPLQGGDG